MASEVRNLAQRSANLLHKLLRFSYFKILMDGANLLHFLPHSPKRVLLSTYMKAVLI